jgi:hypothetical protein
MRGLKAWSGFGKLLRRQRLCTSSLIPSCRDPLYHAHHDVCLSLRTNLHHPQGRHHHAFSIKLFLSVAPRCAAPKQTAAMRSFVIFDRRGRAEFLKESQICIDLLDLVTHTPISFACPSCLLLPRPWSESVYCSVLLMHLWASIGFGIGLGGSEQRIKRTRNDVICG